MNQCVMMHDQYTNHKHGYNTGQILLCESNKIKNFGRKKWPSKETGKQSKIK